MEFIKLDSDFRCPVLFVVVYKLPEATPTWIPSTGELNPIHVYFVLSSQAEIEP